MQSKEFALANFRFDVRTGRFDLLSNEESTRIFIKWGAEEDQSVNFHLPEDDVHFDDRDYPCEQLVELAKQWMNRMMFSTAKRKVDAFLNWAEEEPEREEDLSNLDYFDWAWACRQIPIRGANQAREASRLQGMRTFVTGAMENLS